MFMKLRIASYFGQMVRLANKCHVTDDIHKNHNLSASKAENRRHQSSPEIIANKIFVKLVYY